MLSVLIGGALLAGAAYSAYQLLQMMQQSSGKGGKGQGESGDNEETDRRRSTGISGDLIDSIVSAVKFAINRKVTLREEPTPIPTDQINIRPIASVSELGTLLPSAIALDDDVFFGQLAGHQLPVREFIETIREEQKARNALVWVQDCSGSMEENQRLRWAINLGEKLAEKCAKEEAECVLIPFNDCVQEIVRAQSRDECLRLKNSIGGILFHSGGTNISGALYAAIEEIGAGEFDGARIVLVTDGTESVSVEEIEDRLHKANIFLHTICIGQDNDSLREVSERYDLLLDQDLVDEQEAA